MTNLVSITQSANLTMTSGRAGGGGEGGAGSDAATQRTDTKLPARAPGSILDPDSSGGGLDDSVETLTR